MKAHLITGGLFLSALLFALAMPASDSQRALAEERLGPVQRHPIAGPPVYYSEEGTALFFENNGMEGPIRGVAFLRQDVIQQVLLLHSREGVDHRALDDARFMDSFTDMSIKAPLVVDAISGATISSQRVMDGLNRRLRAHDTWRKANSEL